MSEVTLAERGATSTSSVEEGDLLLPLPGNWSAVARLADPDQPAWLGKMVTLDWMGQQFQGTVDAEAVAEGKTTLFIVGRCWEVARRGPGQTLPERQRPADFAGSMRCRRRAVHRRPAATASPV